MSMAKAMCITSQHVHFLVSTCAGMMEPLMELCINSVIQGYHVYKDEWDSPNR